MHAEKCDLCGRINKKEIYKFEHWTLLQCNRCGLRWGSSNGSTPNVCSIYDRNYFNSENASKIGYKNYLQEEKVKTRSFNYWYRKIERISKKGSCLDIGCAYGYSVKVAKNRGWHSYGIDISEHAVCMAKKENNNIKCVNYFKFNNNIKFDLITAWDVLEHMISPKKFLQKTINNLTGDGLIAITTPIYDFCFAKYYGQNWFEYKWPEHLYYFSRESLIEYFRQLNLEIICFQYAIKFKPILNALFRLVGKYEANNHNIFSNICVPYTSFSEAFIIVKNANNANSGGK
jgi:2-polyprenyl-3-methyl-5-hydroxy-6-metoxy-1,4-benzoquinol methylase